MCPAIKSITKTNVMTTTTSEPDASRLCNFLADYAACLFGSGATCIRLEKNVSRMASRAGMEVRLSIMPRHIHVNVSGADGSAAKLVDTSARPVSFDVNTRLSRLSWDYADGKVGFDELQTRFREIAAAPGGNPWVVLVLA